GPVGADGVALHGVVAGDQADAVASARADQVPGAGGGPADGIAVAAGDDAVGAVDRLAEEDRRGVQAVAERCPDCGVGADLVSPHRVTAVQHDAGVAVGADHVVTYRDTRGLRVDAVAAI